MVTRRDLEARKQDARLDVLAAWRAIEAGDYATVGRVYATADDRASLFLWAVRLCSAFAHRWLDDDPEAIAGLIDYLVAEEYAEEVNRL